MDARHLSKQEKPEYTPNGGVELVLDWDSEGDPIVIDNSQPIVIGSATEADICFSEESTSRVHAKIQWQGNCFMLWDLSTNGSFVRTEDEQIRFIRRNGVRLWGEGSICFNGADFSQCVLNFRHVTG